MPIFGVLVNFLIGGLAISLPTLIRRLLWSLGIGAVVFTGMNLVLNQLATLALNQFNGIPAVPLQVMGILNIDTAFSMIISAYSMRLTLKFMGGVAPKQMKLF